MQPAQPHDDNSKLDALVAQYLEALERGEQPDRNQFLQQHPDFSTELQKFFADLDKVQAAKEKAQPELDATIIHQHQPKPCGMISGRYKLLENIGEGGMGSVWVAEQQQPVKRRVAIKLIKAGMDSKQVLARFEAERQALAVMDHPNIAKVFDGGMTEQGRPYFVMEYVKGVPFTEYCDKARLSLKERLNLFIPVCQAVQHAHHKGIVHRDLKPSNILICLYDGKPVPKVIDFGLAKAMHQSLTDQSIYTGHGIMVGTPLYMSPEQAEHNNLDVDTRTDIYSLGVVLYELLVGTTPLERDQLRKAAVDEVLRLIREVEPLRPSVRLSSSANLPSIAAQRSIDPRHLQKSLAGDLDWIVMKSLEKERTRRYETANSLVRDIERFLNDEAVEACPPSRSYRLKKFIRKHRGKVIAGSTVLLAMLVGATGATWGWFRATEAEQTIRESLGEVTKERDAKTAALSEKSAALTAEAAQRILADTQRDLAERQLIEGLLRPIGYGDDPNTAELRSFVDWSAVPDARLKMRILEVAFDNPEVAVRVARRAERAVQSCIGLSPTRRAKAIELMSAKQRDMNSDPRIRVAAAWLALELGSTDSPALAEALTWLSHPNSASAEPRPEFTEVVDFITRRVKNLSPEQITCGGDAIIGVLEKTTDWYALGAAGNGLVALAPKLNPDQITRGGNAFIAVLEKTTDSDALRATGNGLVALAPKLSPEQITRGWDAFIGVLEKTTNYDALRAAGDGLVALAPKLSPEQITRGGDALIGVLEKTTDKYALSAAGDGLGALAPKLSPGQITRAGDAFIGVLEKTTGVFGILANQSLGALAEKLSPEQITRGGDAIIGVLEKTTDDFDLIAAGFGLMAFAPKLSPEQITRGWAAIIGRWEKTTDDRALHAAEFALGVLARKRSSEQITRAGDARIGRWEKMDDDRALHAAGFALGVLAPKLSSEQITRAGDSFIGVLEKPTDTDAMRAAGIGLRVLAPKLSPEQITRAGDALIGVLEKTSDDGVLDAEYGLVALAAKLNPEQITRGGDALLGVLEKTTDRYALGAAGNVLVALAPKLSPEQITRGWDALIAVLEKATDSNALRAAGNALVALAPKLSPDMRMQTADLFVASLHRIDGGGITEQLLAIMPQLERPTQDRISNEVMTILLDYLAVSDGYFEGDYGGVNLSAFSPGVMAMMNERSLASLLQHPAAMGEAREFLLPRFEELVFHDGKHVLLPLPETLGERQGNDENPPSAIPAADVDEHGGLTPNRSPGEPPPRRFHNLHDAAAWIQQNWPDFDLEATHPVIWRGER